MGYRDNPTGMNVDLGGGEADSGPCDHEETIWNRDLPDGKQQRTCTNCGQKTEVESQKRPRN